jgi:hypothetical protein
MKDFPKVGTVVNVTRVSSVSFVGNKGNQEKEYLIEKIMANESKVLQSNISGTLALCSCDIDSNSIIFVIDISDLEETYQNGKIYISGGISYNPKEANIIFDKVELVLRKCGWEALNPFSFNHTIAKKMERDGASSTESHKEYMRVCINEMLVSDCTKIVLVKGWETSAGAKMEIDLAKKYGYKFYCIEDSDSKEMLEVELDG